MISIIGAGSLSLSYGLSQFGLVPGIGVLLFSAYLSYYTLDLLLIAVEHLPKKSKISYRSLAMHTYGDGLALFIQIVLLIQFFGASVSYVVAYSGLLDLVYRIYFGGSIYTYLAILVYSLLVIPLGLFRSMSKLRFTSMLGFSCSLYLTVVIFVEYFVLCSDDGIRSGGDFGPSHLSFSTCFWSRSFSEKVLRSEYLFPFQSASDFVSGFVTIFPLNLFAYICHPYTLPVYAELRPTETESRSDRMRKVLKTAMSISTAVYLVISTSGFLLFLSATCGNVLQNQFHQHVDAVIAAMGISLSCILTLPIYAFTFRRSFGDMIWGIKQLPTARHVTVTVVFGAVCVITGISVTSVSVVFGLLGSTTYPLLGNILPAVFFLKLVPPHKFPTKRRVAFIQMIFVSVVSILSVTYKVYQIVSGSARGCSWVQQIQT